MRIEVVRNNLNYYKVLEQAAGSCFAANDSYEYMLIEDANEKKCLLNLCNFIIYQEEYLKDIDFIRINARLSLYL